jgi:hypothetical protein
MDSFSFAVKTPVAIQLCFVKIEAPLSDLKEIGVTAANLIVRQTGSNSSV